MSRKTLITAQLVITFCMAFTMCGVMMVLMSGFDAQMLTEWPKTALMAWPIAFFLTQFYGPLGFMLAGLIWGKPAK